MIRQTGGFANGATSTRSRSSWRAIESASGKVLIPTWLPSAPMRRTSRARMRSLYRGSFCCGVAMADHSCAMGCSPCWLSSCADAKPRYERATPLQGCGVCGAMTRLTVDRRAEAAMIGCGRVGVGDIGQVRRAPHFASVVGGYTTACGERNLEYAG